MAQDFRASILAQLDTSNIQKEIDAIGKRNIKFSNISFDTTQLTNSIQAALSNHRFNINLGNVNINSQSFNQQAQSIGSSAGQNFTSSFNRAIQGINISNSINEINRVKDILKSYKFDTSSITAVTKSLETMRLQIDSIKTSISSGNNGSNIRLTIQGTDEMKRAVQVVKELKAGEKEVAEVSRAFTQNFAQQEQQAQKNAAAVTKYIAKLEELTKKATDPNSAKPIQKTSLLTAYEEVAAEIERLGNADSTTSTKIIANIEKKISGYRTFISELQNAGKVIRSNEALATQYDAQLAKIQSKAIDPNARNPVLFSDGTALSNQYHKVQESIAALRVADTSATEQMVANVKREISALESLIAEEQNVVASKRADEQQAQKNAAAIATFNEKISELKAKAYDQNGVKPIMDASNVSELNKRFNDTQVAINGLKNASSSTFTGMKADVAFAMNELELLIIRFQNAEYAASQLRAKPVEVVKAEEIHKLDAFYAEISKSGVELSSFTSKAGELRGVLDKVANASQLTEYLNRLSVAKSEFKALKQEAAQYASATDVSILKSKMETWLLKNTKAAQTYGLTVRQLISELESMSSKGRVLATDTKRIASAFREVDAATAAAGMKGRTFFESIGKAAQSLGRYFGVSMLIYRSIATLRQGINDVIDLDTALVDLQKTAKATSEELSRFYYDANEQAKQFGVTTKEIISSAADWSRLGYSLNDSKTMAQVSSIFKSISPGMDMESATSGLVSTMKAYNIAANDALDGIASKINAIGKRLPKHTEMYGERKFLVDNYIG